MGNDYAIFGTLGIGQLMQIRTGNNNVLKGKQLCEIQCGIIEDSKLLSYP